MGQIKVFGNREFLNKERTKISEAIHGALVESLSFPKDKKFQRYFPLEKEDFMYPDDRSEKYLIIEISIFEGRSKDTKKLLVKKIFENLEREVGINSHSVEITMFETPKENWGIRGSNGDELQLNYKVEV